MNTFLPDVLEYKHVDTLLLLCDGIIHETTVDQIRDAIAPDFPEDQYEEYLKTFTKPSETPGFREAVYDTINSTPTEAVHMCIVLTTALDSRILAPTLTNSLTPIKDMTLKEREQLLAAWRDSPIAAKRRLFRLISSLTLTTFTRLASDLHLRAIHYPGRDLREKAYETQVVDPFRYLFMEKPKFDGTELYLPDIDVIIIGSGAGAGVMAHTLANDGYKTLVLEKGKYFSNSELNFNDADGMKELYQGKCALTTTNQQMFILAGSTLGGGTTVNWSACLKTPFKVRKEWYDEFGLEFAADEAYDKAQDYVWKQMGASTEGITHSLANAVVVEGGKKLGYKSKEIEQNNGGHPDHPCGFCYLGCKYGIKQGSVNNWFRDAAAHGSKFMQQVRVVQILHNKGVAYGILCEDVETGVKFTISGPKKFVVSAGSLNTPTVLTNSGFKNKHIGKNLTLHPVSTVFGDFGRDVQADHFHKSIMTSLCYEVADLDGKGHGCRIETILNAPFIQASLLPWRGSDEVRRDLLRYNNMVAMLLITRDTTSGSVSADPKKPDALIVDYDINKFDKNAILQAFLITSDMLYIEGAKRILSPQAWVPIFESNKPKEQRTIKDKDYVEWRAKAAKIPFDTYGSAYGSAHQMSTCRMSGKGPKYGAVDTDGRLFECSNVYVADASVLPTASGANPMISTMTFARQIALGLADSLKTKPKL
ncbi:Long-chain-alcohol oxidase FAO2 [Candida viswanathii]|jgi:choline dehydrogenase-like flavoprotein|uniref:Long-chain-alcohol oxidase n=1 Tax=Candida viswanathii TaxID=5486 RepID=A0A367YBJ7_9ASCO|nr:Long-chain-alcohol oxidase FAO2 [Candida viswanathii]